MLSIRPVTHISLRRCFIVLLFFLLLPPLNVSAQTDTATISGSVLDTTEAGIPGASIDLENTSTGVHLKAIADKKGVFLIVGIRPGRYELSVSREGFATTKLDDIVLNVGDRRVVEIKLNVGSVSEVTDVDASGPTINTTDASVGTVVDRKFVENIPLNGRSLQDLISMTPGVLTQTPQTNSSVGSKGDFSVNGQRTESNYYTVDGVSGNVSPGAAPSGPGATIATSTALGTTQSLVSVDALQEFRVESSTYSAEYGHGPGGQFSFVTRSGVNTPHGTAFDYLRNNYFDANNWFNDQLKEPEAPLRQNDFGGTFGGPFRIPWIYNGTNRTFFFVSYEGLRLAQPQAASIGYVPDTALRINAAQALQSLLNAFPIQNGKEELVPCTAGATATYPCPVGTPVGTLVQSGLADFTEPYSLPSSINSTSVRLDHTLGPRFAIFFRFGGTPSSTSSRTLAELTRNSSDTYTYTFGATSQLARNFTNEFRLGYARANASVVSSLDNFGGATPVGVNAAFGIPQTVSGAEAIILLSFAGVGSTSWSAGPLASGTRSWNITDGISLLRGHHRVKGGVDFARYNSLINPDATQADAYYFSPQAVNSNQATSAYIIQNASSAPLYYNTALYAQDDWQATPKLSLSFGLRWEVDPAPHSSNANDAYTFLGSLSSPSSLTLAPRGTSLWDTYWYNFAPRLGGAWILHPARGGETVFRAGCGVFFDTYNEVGGVAFSGLGFQTLHSITPGALPFASSLFNFSASATTPYTSLYAFPTHLQVPYTLQWNTSIEQALGSAQSLTVSYVGANGRRLINAQSVSLGTRNPNFGTVYEFPGGITSNYQALQAKFQRSVSHGVQALVSYTWSHSIDFGSTYASFGLTRGNSDFDIRHNLSAGMNWDIPATEKSRLAGVLLDNWGLDGRLTIRTGFPLTLLGNTLTDPTTGNTYYSGVNLTPGKPFYLYGSQYPGRRALNGGPAVPAGNAAFTRPTGTNAGNAPRNFVRGFGENQVNMAVRRTFPIKNALSLQFRAEAFNVLNHPNFGLINTTLTNAQFGLATKTLNQSLATLASQYQQGGPRSMQFALKLQF